MWGQSSGIKQRSTQRRVREDAATGRDENSSIIIIAMYNVCVTTGYCR